MTRLIDMLRLRARSLFMRSRVDAELERELNEHLQSMIDEKIAAGMNEADARSQALREFGGFEQIRMESRDARGVAFIENLLRDMRYAWRGLVRDPLLVVAATLSIALGASGNIAVFSLAKSFLLAVPDARDVDTLVHMEVSHGSHATYQRWQELQSTGIFAGLAGSSVEKQVNLRTDESAIAITPMIVTSNFFDVVGVPIEYGRAFSNDEARAELAPHLVLISHSFWMTRFGGDPNILQRSITLNGEPYRIIGVIAPKVRSVSGFALSPDVYVALNRSLMPEMSKSDTRILQLTGRLKQDQTLQQARVATDAADRRFGRLAGDTVFAGVQELAHFSGIESGRRGRTLAAFFTLLGLISLFVPFIACGNVAGLLIARSTTHRKETAIRIALGASRARLVQQLLFEGFWLALLGTALGLALSVLLLRYVETIRLPIPLPVVFRFDIDTSVFAWAIGVIVLCTLFTALLPALRASRPSITPALSREEPIIAGKRMNSRNVLLVGQVMVSTLLLVTTMLFIRNLRQTQTTSPGFDARSTIVAQIGVVEGLTGAQRMALLDRIVAQLEGLAGVDRISTSDAIPLTINVGSSNGRTVKTDIDPKGTHIEYVVSAVSPGYFPTMGIPITSGREFSDDDRPGAQNTLIINEHLSRKLFGSASAIGRLLKFSDNDVSGDYQVVGVAANSKHTTLGEEQRGAIYFPIAQHAEQSGPAFVIVKATTQPSLLLDVIKKRITAADPSISVDVRTMSDAISFAMLPSQIGAVILGGLGTLGILLATFGLYAIVSYTVTRRSSEIAIRSALGATSTRIVRLVVSDASVLVIIGLVLGLSIAAFVTQPLAVFLVEGLSTTDPLSFLATAVVFILATVLASWLPARKAMSVDPAMAMRLE